MTAPVELQLDSPIRAHNETATTLLFQPMTARHLRTIGMPLDLNQKADPRVVSAMIVALANIPESSVDQLSPLDWYGAMAVVLGFLAAPTVPTSSEPPTNSAGSTAT